MNKPFGTYALLSLALVVIGFLENTFFGADTGGFKHHLSVVFFLLAVLGVVGVVVFGVLAVVKRVRATS